MLDAHAHVMQVKLCKANTRGVTSEEDEAWVGADFFGIRDPEAMRRFMIASDYCFDYSDSDDEGTYDPTRECFHIGLGMPRASNESEGAGCNTSGVNLA